jgi:AraC family transcriptional regulator
MEFPVSQAVAFPPQPMSRLIHDERRWLELPRSNPGHEGARIVPSRWVGSAAEAREAASEIDSDHHVVGIALRPMNAAFYADRTLISDGRVSQGTIAINKPGQSLRAVFRGGYDMLHLHVPNTLLASYLDGSFENPAAVAEIFTDHTTLRDHAIERLANGLVHADNVGDIFGPKYVDSICVAMLARLLDVHSAAAARSPKQTVSALAKWRLKRATDFIEQHLSEPIGLADLATSTGLSRMHFAAQFRAATGMRPHEYLVWRRIERAMTLLRNRRQPLCEVALDVGFKTQAHFTTVFKRIAGKTPNEWRHQNADPHPEISVRPADALSGHRPWIGGQASGAPRLRGA